MRNALNTLILFILVSVSASAQVPAQTLPEFTFFRSNNANTAFTQKDVPRGKMLFFFFFDPDCEHCQHAVENMGKNYPSFKNVSMYLVSMEEENKINQFINRFGHNLKGRKNVILLRDPLHLFITRFHPRRYPSMFLFSGDGKLLDYEDNEETVFRFLRFTKE